MGVHVLFKTSYATACALVKFARAFARIGAASVHFSVLIDPDHSIAHDRAAYFGGKSRH